MKKLSILLVVALSLNFSLNQNLYASDVYKNIEKKVKEFNQTQFASALKALIGLCCFCSAARSGGKNAKMCVKNLREEQYSSAFDNSVVSASTIYISGLSLFKTIDYVKHALDIK